MPSRSVLLIDDEIDLLEELEDGLSSRGLRVATARTGQEGLTKIERSPPDLIICDISMPGMSGFEVLEHVRRMPLPISTIPFVFLTAHSGVEDEIRGRGFGADDYIAKPVDLKRLHAIIGSRLVQAERFEEAARARITAAQERLAAASEQRMAAMERAFTDLRPLLREASGANLQLMSLMEGISEPDWVDLARSTNDRLRSAQGIVRRAGILAAVPPAPPRLSPQLTPLADTASLVSLAAASRMERGGTRLSTDDGLVKADPDGLRTLVAAAVVWAADVVPSAHVSLAGTGSRLAIHISSDHRRGTEIKDAWSASIGNTADPVGDVARLLVDAVEVHGGSLVVTADETTASLDIELNAGPDPGDPQRMGPAPS